MHLTRAARLKGLEEDLHMSGTQFNTLISILYVGYVLMQTPSWVATSLNTKTSYALLQRNWFISRIERPSVYLAGGMLLWGALSIGTGVSQRSAIISILKLIRVDGLFSATIQLLSRVSYSDLWRLRFFLELFSFFPDGIFFRRIYMPLSVLLRNKRYTRNELGLRIAILTCGSSISNAFGSLIASGILSMMDGTLGVPAWRWWKFTLAPISLLIFLLGGCFSQRALWLSLSLPLPFS